MTREDLFLAIGMVEETRLMRTELEAADTETKPRKTGRVFRNFLIAAIVVSMLAVTAYAVAGYLIFESPEAMITAIFGDKTGYDHKGVTTWTDPEKPGDVYENPGFDRVPVDETLAAEIVPNVTAVGKFFTWRGYTLTVDAILYDSVTQCGVLTYQLTNPEGIKPYNVESNGEVWGHPVNFNTGGESYMIREKTTDTCLSVAQYFWYDPEDPRDMELTISQWTFVEPGPEYQAHILELFEQIKQEYTMEEAMNAYIQEHGQEEYDRVSADSSEEQMENLCYSVLWTKRLEELYACPEKITIDPNRESELNHITFYGGAITISPISMLIDVSDMNFLHTDYYGDFSVSADNIRSLTIRYADGTEYVVLSEQVNNTVDVLNSQNGNTGAYVLGKILFNRIIDVEEISAVYINGVELPVV